MKQSKIQESHVKNFFFDNNGVNYNKFGNLFIVYEKESVVFVTIHHSKFSFWMYSKQAIKKFKDYMPDYKYNVPELAELREFFKYHFGIVTYEETQS